MERQQIDQYDMMLSVENHFDDNPTLWAGNAPLTATKTLLSTKVDLLAAQVAIQLLNYTGITADKDASRAILESLGYSMGAALRSFAGATGKDELYKNTNFTRTDLSRFRDAELVGISTNLALDATTNLAALAPYGIVAGTITALNTANTNFGSIMKNPTGAIAKRSTATAEIAKIIPDIITTILERRLDNDIEMLATTQPAFVTAYGTLRLINDSPTQTLSATFQSVIQGSNLPLEAVEIRVTPANLDRTTSARGYSSILNLVAGTHNLVAKRPGYVATKMDFVVVNGMTTEVVIVMVPE